MMMSQSKSDLQKAVAVLASDIGERNLHRYEALKRTEQYITKEFESFGYKPIRQTYVVSHKEVANIIAEVPGRKSKNIIVVIGAHYDTVPGCPGANDNGTGVASMLALAKWFADKPLGVSLQFVAFVNEEAPYFQSEAMGSYVYVQNLKKDQSVKAMLSLETMGYYSDLPKSQRYPTPLNWFYPDRGNFIGLVANRNSKELLKIVADAFQKSGSIPFEKGAFPEFIPGVSWSDQWSFWQKGYPALMITDTAPYRYPHYHLGSDTAEHINYDKLEAVTQNLAIAIEFLGNE